MSIQKDFCKLPSPPPFGGTSPASGGGIFGGAAHRSRFRGSAPKNPFSAFGSFVKEASYLQALVFLEMITPRTKSPSFAGRGIGSIYFCSER